MPAPKRAMPAVDLLVPGTLDALTGGYLYDRRIFAELARLGWQTRAHSLDASFPEPDEAALALARATLAAIPDGRLVVIDGLALAGLGPLLPGIVARHRPVALIHHPLADETGLAPERAGRLKAAETAALGLMPRVIVTSAWTRQRLAAYGIEAGRIAVVEPGTDARPVDDTDADRDRAATEDATERGATGPLRLLCVATITPRKGHDVLIDALSRLADRDWTLRCVGSRVRDPACAERLARQIERTGLGARIEWVGEVEPDALAQEYARADLFVLPSRLEGYGMVLAEAIAHGLPIISTTAGAIPNTVPRDAARLVPPGDIGSLAAALDELMTDGHARARLGAGARRAARNLPRWADAGRRFAAVLDSVAAR